MEFCSLGDLSAYIKRRKAAPSGQGPAGGLYEIVSRHFLKQLASALEFLRSKNLIHRDIKPQNLLLLPPNTNQSGRPVIGLPNYPTLKIADFGFARSLPSHSLAETLCGSPLYMAPEILRYEKYDAKADLWSVGAVLYEMVTGRPPFRALNHVELLHKIEKGGDNIRFPGEPSWSSKNRDDGYDIDIPTTSVPLVSDDMKDVIRHLLKRNPVERISFEEFFYHPAVTTDLENISAAAAARVVVDDGLTVVPLSAQLSLPQPPAQTISTPARRATDRYEPPPFAQQDSKPASSPREQRKQPLLKRQEDLGFANMQYEKQGNRPASEGAKRSPLPPQGVVSRNTVGMQRNVEKEALVENRQTNNVQSDHYRAHDPLVSRPTTRVRPIRSNSFDVNSPPNSILIQRPGDFIAADEAEQREREIPGLPRRRGSVGGTGTESLREFYRGTASTTAEDDVMIEREYVVVDKGAVEVNELADQLAASPVNNMIVARTRSPFRQNSTSSGLLAHSPSPPFISPYSNHSSTSPPGIAASHYYGTTPPFAIPGSTTTQQDRAWNGTPSSGGNSGGSALAKAISAASMRLLGPGNSPPSRGEKYLYNRRGSSGSTSSGNAIVVFGGGGDDPEEDAIIKTIEDAACKAHAVEQLAQAKYDMIAPPPPAAAEALLQFDATQDKSKIADEAFVLYLKTLALLQSGLDVAKEHWSKQRAGLANNVQPKAASVRLNEGEHIAGCCGI
ncbi:kinase-like domain-containing protein [Endogone sp. FLAS-F59071]|nr:kinase-like domain-containing protein [Endogone sp. FLAS-F59071]|eukprot:RUS14525.1 kinase-like domain-containing protein [Endogone sp. FLAS-F59071]